MDVPVVVTSGEGNHVGGAALAIDVLVDHDGYVGRSHRDRTPLRLRPHPHHLRTVVGEALDAKFLQGWPNPAVPKDQPVGGSVHPNYRHGCRDAATRSGRIHAGHHAEPVEEFGSGAHEPG